MATVEDISQIAAVHVQSWRESYQGIIKQEILDELSVEQRAALLAFCAGTDGSTGLCL